MDYIYLAKLNKTFGVKGEFKAYCLTDFPKERFKKGNSYFFYDEKKDETLSFTLQSWRDNAPFIILKFEGIDSIEDAEAHLGKYLAILKSEASLPTDSFFIADLIGCLVFDEKGDELGVVVDVFSYSPVQNLRIRKDGRKDIQVPFVDEFIENVDIENKRIVVHLIEGML